MQVDRVVLVNPATSFENSPWPALGPLLPQVPKVGSRLVSQGLAEAPEAQDCMDGQSRPLSQLHDDLAIAHVRLVLMGH